MITRQTSVEAYATIRDSGLLPRRRWEVYDALFHNGPLTASELYARHLTGSMWKGDINARLNELVKLGCVRETCERNCTVTGMTVIEYDVTEHLPSGSIKRHRPGGRKHLMARIYDLQAQRDLLLNALTKIASAHMNAQECIGHATTVIRTWDQMQRTQIATENLDSDDLGVMD